ncbi:hypothetical protein DPMN_116540 [Dreissena polymorpha]|uniref:Uncharacterized protein n=1 Tax=Dreissena polymorpha TaxID=45954 RepID=A0A9D4KP01_DREPO|nr:hypothetical protein DPMN_116540 [Dreissena polymorpha]
MALPSPRKSMAPLPRRNLSEFTTQLKRSHRVNKWGVRERGSSKHLRLNAVFWVHLKRVLYTQWIKVDQPVIALRCQPLPTRMLHIASF